MDRAAATLGLWRRRARERAELQRLDPVLLKDMGVNLADVWRETRKWPWQA